MVYDASPREFCTAPFIGLSSIISLSHGITRGRSLCKQQIRVSDKIHVLLYRYVRHCIKWWTSEIIKKIVHCKNVATVIFIKLLSEESLINGVLQFSLIFSSDYYQNKRYMDTSLQICSASYKSPSKNLVSTLTYMTWM